MIPFLVLYALGGTAYYWFNRCAAELQETDVSRKGMAVLSVLWPLAWVGAVVFAVYLEIRARRAA